MNLPEATEHIDGPVICRAHSKIREGVVRGVSEKRHQVRVEMRYTATRNYQLSGRCEWWHPSRLTIPQWWLDRQAEQEAVEA
ncbi:hypothetical protein O7626_39950 [Micromonospora sp. WMMD1102]|uniref:hypothetical protein n=1 Tax=Micromonospora sp. WMMD1102 TaxID=3016105 RepID=UPI00241550BB|nr:hypothetical protein [Micromonospora sp. WMMD1102]MDG4791990.1 hypothetical protein [Micromonospora sp. WMMD1102]